MYIIFLPLVVSLAPWATSCQIDGIPWHSQFLPAASWYKPTSDPLIWESSTELTSLGKTDLVTSLIERHLSCLIFVKLWMKYNWISHSQGLALLLRTLLGRLSWPWCQRLVQLGRLYFESLHSPSHLTSEGCFYYCSGSWEKGCIRRMRMQ
jgi:hypothetical protein